jgi:hypothetical protein
MAGITGGDRCLRKVEARTLHAKGGFAVTLSRRNLLIAVGVVLAVSVVVLIAVFAGGGSAVGGGGY